MSATLVTPCRPLPPPPPLCWQETDGRIFLIVQLADILHGSGVGARGFVGGGGVSGVAAFLEVRCRGGRARAYR